MAAPDPYASTAEFFDPALHWGAYPSSTFPYQSKTGEKIGNFDPSGEGIYSQEGGEESMVGIVDSARVRGFMRFCLGYNNMTTSASYTLQRTNPIVHPRFTNLVCSGVAHRPFKLIRSGEGLRLTKNDDTTGVVAVNDVINTGGDVTTRSFPLYAGYDKELCTIRFSPAPYRFLSDELASKEYYRNTIIDTEPRTDVLSLSGFQIIYAEGSGNTAPTTNPLGLVSPTEAYQTLVRPDLKVTWHRVPEKFLSTAQNPAQIYPEKILKGLGTVNKGAWLTYPQGTLLFSGCRFIRKPWALAAGLSGFGLVPGSVRESIFNYDVEMLFSYFNPDKGYISNSLIVNSLTYGHNCLPYRGEPTGTTLAADDINAGKWFFATYSGLLNSIGDSTGSRGIYAYTNYDNLFNSAWNADI